MSELRPVPKPKKRPKKLRKPIRRSRVRQKAGKPRRFRARRDEAYLDWIRGLPCALAGRWSLRAVIANYPHECRGLVEAAHVRSRGASGEDFGNAIPLCSYSHTTQHHSGIRTWAAHWFPGGLDELKKLAQQYTERYDRERSVG